MKSLLLLLPLCVYAFYSSPTEKNEPPETGTFGHRSTENKDKLLHGDPEKGEWSDLSQRDEINEEFDGSGTTWLLPTTTTTTMTTTTTTTPTTTTTTIDRHLCSNYTSLAIDVLAGDTKLYRGWKPTKKSHIFSTRGSVLTPSYVSKETFLGYVVSPQTYTSLKVKCPQLVEAYVNIGIHFLALITTKGDRNKATEIFYCSPRKGYCGANFALERFETVKRPVDNLFYPSSNLERNTFNRKRYIKKGFPVCYIWKSVASESDGKCMSVKSAVLSDRNELHGCIYSKKPVRHQYTLLQGGTQACRGSSTTIGTIAVVMSEERFRIAHSVCPNLFKVYLYQTKGANPKTLITRSLQDAGHYELEREFFCAPSRGYCGADREIAYFQSSADYFYPQNEVEAANAECGAYANHGYSIDKNRICWAWTAEPFRDPNY